MPFDRFDATGFPMIQIPQLGYSMQWLPVTKMQFEYFLCDARNAKYDEYRYREILERNERITPRDIEKKNYWQAFITGIRPDEARDFAEWCGDQDGQDYVIPEWEDWREIFNALSTMHPIAIDGAALDAIPNLKPRTRTIIDRMNRVTSGLNSGGYSLADQMLLQNGVMEWVNIPDRDPEYGGMGLPAPRLQSLIRSVTDGPETPRDPLHARLHYFGFRLIVRD